MVLEFIQGDISLEKFAHAIRKRRQLERYYSYIKRNPTNKLSKNKQKFIRRVFFYWQLRNFDQLVAKFKRKLGKSLKKQKILLHLFS